MKTKTNNKDTNQIQKKNLCNIKIRYANIYVSLILSISIKAETLPGKQG